jgi:ribose transport system substrate-binding protein
VWGNSADGDGIKALKQGRITGTMDSNLVASGWAVVKVMNDLLNGKKISSYTVTSTIVDSSNIGSFVDPANRKITFDSIPTASTAP